MIRSFVIQAAGRFGGFSIARRLTRTDPRILMYHRFSRRPRDGFVSADTFERQVKIIKEHYSPTTVVELARRLYENGPGVPDNTVVVSVDDGYRDFYEIAWPILKRHGVPATFYVTTGFVDGNMWLWPDRLRWILERVPPAQGHHEVHGIAIPALDSADRRKQVFEQLVSSLLELPDDEKSDFLDAVAAHFDIQPPASQPDDCQPVSWRQLKEMQEAGIEIGGHSVSHPSLGRVSLLRAESEIRGSRDALERHLGRRDRSFSYPNGAPTDFVHEQVPLVREAGFKCAVVAFADAVGQKHRFAMRRHSSSGDMYQFNKAISGMELLGRRIRGARWLLDHD